jgi:hypothetical protein
METPLEYIYGIVYMHDQIKSKYCHEMMEKDSGISYVPDDIHRSYPCPPGIDNCEHGKCIITTKETCLKHSKKVGPAKDVMPCKTNSECQKGEICVQGKCVENKPYLEFRDGKCLYGNEFLRLWCENPKLRRNGEVKGVTDVPPFHYDLKTGKCEVTKDYCDWMQVSYKIDEKGRPTCYSKTGQKVGEFILGKTLFRDIKYITHMAPDFAGKNVNLYMQGTQLGFLYDEVVASYPELLVGDNLVFKREDLKDKNKKRLFFLLKHTDWVSPSFINAVKRKM